MLAHTLADWLVQAPGVLDAPPPPAIPNPAPKEPPGAKQVLGVLSNVKWAAGAALILGFLMGLIVWAGGRWVDHHRAGKIGVVMMLCAVGGAILYGIGWTLISSFANG